MFSLSSFTAIFVAFVLCACGAFYEGHHYAYLQDQEKIAQAEREVLLKEEQWRANTEAIEQEHAKAVETLKAQTTTIIQKVPIYVTKYDDSKCVVNTGTISLLDAAARGVPDATDPSGGSNDAPSGVKLSTLTAAVAAAFGQYQQVAQQLLDLQAWVRATYGDGKND